MTEESQRRFEEGDIAVIKEKADVRPKYRGEKVRIEEVSYQAYDYRVHVYKNGLKDGIWESDLRSAIPECESCESDKIHHDEKDEWYCPWCSE